MHWRSAFGQAAQSFSAHPSCRVSNEENGFGASTRDTYRYASTRVAGDYRFSSISAGLPSYGLLGEGEPLPAVPSLAAVLPERPAAAQPLEGAPEGLVGGVYAGQPFGDLDDTGSTQVLSQLPGPLAPELVAIVAGSEHYCGLTRNGTAVCAGGSLLGIVSGHPNQATNVTELAPIYGDLQFTALAAGSSFTCGLARNGTLFCWVSVGEGEARQLRMSRQWLSRRLPPTWLSAAWMQGANGDGQLGNYHRCVDTTRNAATEQPLLQECTLGAAYDAPLPVAVYPQLRFSSIAAGYLHVCGVENESGRLLCWG